MPTSIPDNLKQYFWDVDVNKTNPNKHPVWVIQRLLDWNDFAAAKWVLRNFPVETIKETIKTQRGWSKRSIVFWANYFGIPRNEVVCLKPEFLRLQNSHWPF